MYKPIFIAGPCVIETFDILEEVAKELVRLNNKYGININDLLDGKVNNKKNSFS